MTWAEEEDPRWKGPPPKFEVTYDDTNGFLLQVGTTLNAGKHCFQSGMVLQSRAGLVWVQGGAGSSCFSTGLGLGVGRLDGGC